MERAAEQDGTGILAMPTRLHDRRLVAGAFEGKRQALFRGAGVDHEVGTPRRGFRIGERDAELLGQCRPRGIDIDRGHLRPRQPRGECRDQQANNAAADHHDLVAGGCIAVPEDIQGRLEIGREHGAPCRHPFWNCHHVVGRNHETILMRVKREHVSPEKFFGPASTSPTAA